MKIALGSDHAGHPLKNALVELLRGDGHVVTDLTPALDPQDDYPDAAAAVGRAVASGGAERGIVVCGSGVGASVAANKIRGVRAGLCHDHYSARTRAWSTTTSTCSFWAAESSGERSHWNASRLSWKPGFRRKSGTIAAWIR